MVVSNLDYSSSVPYDYVSGNLKGAIQKILSISDLIINQSSI